MSENSFSGDVDTDPISRRPLDETSQTWLAGLRASGRAHDDFVRVLHTLLLLVARREVWRRADAFGLRGSELDDVAYQATDDALMAIMTKHSRFRGDSRFTTWAYAFVVFEVSTKMGRHFWRERRVMLSDEAWEKIPDALVSSPQRCSEHRELFAALRRAIEEDLTPHQRRVFVAVALNEIPIAVFARELGASRNAIYKSLFDARRKLRASLGAAGYERPFDVVGFR